MNPRPGLSLDLGLVWGSDLGLGLGLGLGRGPGLDRPLDLGGLGFHRALAWA